MLLQISLEKEFRSIMDSSWEGYKELTTLEEIADGWGDVLRKYYRSLSFPISGPTNPLLESGIFLFKQNFLLSANSKTLFINLEILIMSLHYTVIGGVTLNGWGTIPPPLPLNLQSAFLKGDYKGTSAEVCKNLAFVIDRWVKTSASTSLSTGISGLWR